MQFGLFAPVSRAICHYAMVIGTRYINVFAVGEINSSEERCSKYSMLNPTMIVTDG